MISKAKKGQSFKGAALYFLHDKDALTTGRVDFTHTGNLATNDPEMAARMMAFTAMHQDEIKRAAGGVLKGRKNTKPVYAYSISWHPSQEPTQEQIIKAGQESLKAVGLDDYEFIMVAHNDEAHKHLHIIVNRVHPETGIAAKLSNDYRSLSNWAEQYERSHGKIFCRQRVENNKKRDKGKFVKDRQSQNRVEYQRFQREKVQQAFQQRKDQEKNLSGLHKEQREGLFKNKNDQLEDLRLKLKEAHRPKWAVIYAQQKAEHLVLQDAQHSAMRRLVYYIKNRNQHRPKGKLTIKSGLLSGAYNAITNGKQLTKTLDNKHKQQRKAFARIVEKNNRSTIEKVKNDYLKEFTRLQTAQRGEREIQKTRHIDESKKLAAALRSGKTEKQFAREKLKKDLDKMAKDLTHTKVGKKSRVDPQHKKDADRRMLKKVFAATGGRKGVDMPPDDLKKDFEQAGDRTEKDIKRDKIMEDFGVTAGNKEKDISADKVKKDFDKSAAKPEKGIKTGKLTKDFNVASGKTQEDTGRKKKDEDMRQLRANGVKHTGQDDLTGKGIKQDQLRKDFGVTAKTTEKEIKPETPKAPEKPKAPPSPRGRGRGMSP